MSLKQRASLQYPIAALLVLSAAFCAAAQSHAVGKQQNTGAGQPGPSKQNTRQQSNAPASTPGPSEPDNQGQSTTEVQPASLKEATDAPHYSYEFKQPDFLISRMLIEHDRDGHGQITFERRGGTEPIVEQIEFSAAARARINALWDALGFLDSDKSYQSERQYPHLGTISLRLRQGMRERASQFNWTNNKDAFALADEYRRAGEQAILIFDISVARENVPLNAPQLMDQLDSMLGRNALSDPQQLIPLLRDLSTDERIPLIARNHAARLLKKIAK